MPSDTSALVERLAAQTGLAPSRCERILADVLAEFGESIEQFVLRRHQELKQQGMRNEAIFAQLQQEIPERRFAVTAPTGRQIRRMIYG